MANHPEIEIVQCTPTEFGSKDRLDIVATVIYKAPVAS